MTCSHDAAFNAAINLANASRGPCAKDTCVDIIEKIIVWANEPDPVKALSVYWLTGLAGLGKTTIAYTICKRWWAELLSRPVFSDFRTFQVMCHTCCHII